MANLSRYPAWLPKTDIFLARYDKSLESYSPQQIESTIKPMVLGMFQKQAATQNPDSLAKMLKIDLVSLGYQAAAPPAEPKDLGPAPLAVYGGRFAPPPKVERPPELPGKPTAEKFIGPSLGIEKPVEVPGPPEEPPRLPEAPAPPPERKREYPGFKTYTELIREDIAPSFVEPYMPERAADFERQAEERRQVYHESGFYRTLASFGTSAKNVAKTLPSGLALLGGEFQPPGVPPTYSKKEMKAIEDRKMFAIALGKKLSESLPDSDREKARSLYLAEEAKEIIKNPREAIMMDPIGSLSTVMSVAAESGPVTAMAFVPYFGPALTIAEATGRYMEMLDQAGITDPNIVYENATLGGPIEGITEFYVDRIALGVGGKLPGVGKLIGKLKSKLSAPILRKVILPVIDALGSTGMEGVEELLQDGAQEIIVAKAFREQRRQLMAAGDLAGQKKLEKAFNDYVNQPGKFTKKETFAMGVMAAMPLVAGTRGFQGIRNLQGAKARAAQDEYWRAQGESMRSAVSDFMDKAGQISPEAKIQKAELQRALDQARVEVGDLLSAEADTKAAVTALDQAVEEAAREPEAPPAEPAAPAEAVPIPEAPPAGAPVAEGQVRMGALVIPQQEVDRITGIPNQNTIREQVELAMKDPGMMTLLIDIDRFKAINDVLGHDGGDDVLAAMGNKTREIFNTDIYGRYGGEEFAVIVPATQENVNKAHSFVQSIPETVTAAGEPVTISAGLAVGTVKTREGQERLYADRLLYEAKERGRNQLVVDFRGKKIYLKGREVGPKKYEIRHVLQQVEGAEGVISALPGVSVPRRAALKGALQAFQEAAAGYTEREAVRRPGEPPGARPGTVETVPVSFPPAEIDRTPTPAQIEAGNYKKPIIVFDNLRIRIENDAGSVRKSKPGAKKPWKTTLKHHYGYFEGYKGKDKDKLDVFLNPGAPSGLPVFVVNQVNPATRAFDEHKVMMGFKTAKEAVDAYTQNYQPGFAAEIFAGVASFTPDTFQAWISTPANLKKPVRSGKKMVPGVDFPAAAPARAPVAKPEVPEKPAAIPPTPKKAPEPVKPPKMTEAETRAAEEQARARATERRRELAEEAREAPPALLKEESEAYLPEVGAALALLRKAGYPTGTVMHSAVTDPARAKQLVDRRKNVLAAIREDGPTQELLQKAYTDALVLNSWVRDNEIIRATNTLNRKIWAEGYNIEQGRLVRAREPGIREAALTRAEKARVGRTPEEMAARATLTPLARWKTAQPEEWHDLLSKMNPRTFIEDGILDHLPEGYQMGLRNRMESQNRDVRERATREFETAFVRDFFGMAPGETYDYASRSIPGRREAWDTWFQETMITEDLVQSRELKETAIRGAMEHFNTLQKAPARAKRADMITAVQEAERAEAERAAKDISVEKRGRMTGEIAAERARFSDALRNRLVDILQNTPVNEVASVAKLIADNRFGRVDEPATGPTTAEEKAGRLDFVAMEEAIRKYGESLSDVSRATADFDSRILEEARARDAQFGEIPFSRRARIEARPVTQERAERMATDIIARLAPQLKGKYMVRVADVLPGGMTLAAEDEAVLDRKPGISDIYISSKLRPERLRYVLIHEIVGHLGALGIARTDEGVLSYLQNLYVADYKENSVFMRALRRDYGSVFSEIEAKRGDVAANDFLFNEWLARRLEDHFYRRDLGPLTAEYIKNRSVWQAFTKALRGLLDRFLRRAGFTQTQISDYIDRAIRDIARSVRRGRVQPAFARAALANLYKAPLFSRRALRDPTAYKYSKRWGPPAAHATGAMAGQRAFPFEDVVATFDVTQLEEGDPLYGAGHIRDGGLVTYHVSDDPAQTINDIRAKKDLTDFGSPYDDLGKGFYTSDSPNFWRGRQRSKFNFLRHLTTGQRTRLAAAALQSAEDTWKKHKGYWTQDEYDRVKENIKQYRDTGNEGYILSVIGQPYNIDISRPEFLEDAGIVPSEKGGIVELGIKGKIAKLSRSHMDTETRNALREKGYVGAYTPSGFGSNPQMVVWDRSAIDYARSADKSRLFYSRRLAETEPATKADPFYLKAVQALGAVPMERAPADQWRAMLAPEKGIRREELELMGLPEFLESLGNTMVTKGDLMRYIKDNALIPAEIVHQGQEMTDQEKESVIQGATNMALGMKFDDMIDKGEIQMPLFEVEPPAGKEKLYQLITWDTEKRVIDTFENESDAERAREKLENDVQKEYFTDLSNANYSSVYDEQAALLRPNFEKTIEGDTKYPEQTSPGGENYQEIIFAIPEERRIDAPVVRFSETKKKYFYVHKGAPGKTGWNSQSEAVADFYNKTGMYPFTESHFEDNGHIIAHGRTKDRRLLGDIKHGHNIKHIEEVQSDVHEEGRRAGYKSGALGALMAFEEMYAGVPTGGWEKGRMLDYLEHRYSKAYPDYPFKRTWHEMVFKRILRQAVEEGKDYVSWTKGETQVGRYDLSKYINILQYGKNKDGTYWLTVPENMGAEWTSVTEERLERVIGRDAAKKIRNNEGRPVKILGTTARELDGLDLKTGGAGMKAFYDQILVNFVNKYVRKWGGRVEEITLDIGKKGGEKAWAVHLNDPMMRAVLYGGQPLYSRRTVPVRVYDPAGQNNVAIQAPESMVGLPEDHPQYVNNVWQSLKMEAARILDNYRNYVVEAPPSGMWEFITPMTKTELAKEDGTHYRITNMDGETPIGHDFISRVEAIGRIAGDLYWKGKFTVRNPYLMSRRVSPARVEKPPVMEQLDLLGGEPEVQKQIQKYIREKREKELTEDIGVEGLPLFDKNVQEELKIEQTRLLLSRRKAPPSNVIKVQDDRVFILNYKAIPWGKISRRMKSLGYDYRGAPDAENLYRLHAERGLSGQMAETLKWAVGYGEYLKAEKTEAEKTITKAKRHFGLTRDYKEVGYLTPDGDMLDFSGRKEGGPGGTRARDHREINFVETNMLEFMGMGNIRMFPEVPGADITKEPTVKQYNRLRGFFNWASGEIVLDLESVDPGIEKKSIEYKRGTSANRIISEIQSYYAGRKAVPSKIREFHVEGEEDVLFSKRLPKKPEEPTQLDHAIAEAVVNGKLRRKGPDIHPDEVQPETDVEKRMDAAKGLKRPKMIEKVRLAVVGIKNDFTRADPRLDPKKYGYASEILRQYKAISDYSDAVSANYIHDIISGLGPNKYKVMTYNIILPDLITDVEAGLHNEKGIPFGAKDAEELKAIYERYRNIAKKYPDVMETLERRDKFMNALKKEQIELGLLPKELAEDPYYFHHQVLSKMAERTYRGLGTRPRDVRVHKSGYQYGRTGSAEDYNTEYLEAEFEVVAQGLAKVETMKSQKLLMDRYDITKELKIEADRVNEENWIGKDALQRIKDLKAERELARTAEERARVKELTEQIWALDPRMKYRATTAMARARLAKMAYDGIFTSPDIIEGTNVMEEIERQGFGHVVDMLSQEEVDRQMKGEGITAEPKAAPKIQNAEFFKFLAFLLNKGFPGAVQAGTIYKAISGVKKEMLGSLEARNIRVATLMAVAPEGYTEWSPELTSPFYAVEAVIDRKVREIQESGVAEVSVSDLKKVMAMGKKPYWIIPEELSATLDDIKITPPTEGGIIDRAMKAVMTSWKQWTLFNPFHVVKYFTNNMSGDLDISIAYDPAIMKEFPKAATDLWQFQILKKKPTAELLDATRKGVIGSGFNAQEIEDIGKEGIFSIMTGREPGFVVKGWRWSKNINEWRENILRLAAYRRFKKRLARGDVMYGASKKAEVDEVKDLDTRAGKLARELIGDYGNISKAGQWLRGHLVPFYSWIEINAPRYARLLRNIPNEGAPGITAGGRIAKMTGIKAARTVTKMFILYTLVNLWNRLVWPKEEEELGEMNRQLHIIVGRRKDGSIITFRFQGAVSDAMGWFGLEDLPNDVWDLVNDKSDFLDKIKEGGLTALQRAISAVGPFYKIYEPWTGSLWPDFRNPRTVRDKWEWLSKMFSLSVPYRFAMGKPTRGYREFQKMLVYEYEPGEAAFISIMQLIREFNDKYSEAGGFRSQPTQKANAIYYYKKALKFGDMRAAKKYIRQYVELGGTSRSFKSSIKGYHPLMMVDRKLRRRFMEKLDKKELKQLEKAIDWWKETYVNQTNKKIEELLPYESDND